MADISGPVIAIALVLAAVFGSLAYLDRYIGLSVLGISGLALLVFNQRRFSRRIIQAVFYGLAGVLPSLLWMLRNWLLVGSATNRSIGVLEFTITNTRAAPAAARRSWWSSSLPMPTSSSTSATSASSSLRSKGCRRSPWWTRSVR